MGFGISKELEEERSEEMKNFFSLFCSSSFSPLFLGLGIVERKQR